MNRSRNRNYAARDSSRQRRASLQIARTREILGGSFVNPPTTRRQTCARVVPDLPLDSLAVLWRMLKGIG